MKIAFFWTGDFSKNILEWILKYKNIEVCLLVSQPDKPVWRKKILEKTQVRLFSEESDLSILQPNNLKNNLEFLEKLRFLDLDFAVVVAYWKIIPKNLLDIPKFGFINIHWSILPNYRWASPIQEAIKKWDTETGLTIMQMSAWMDEWNIFEIKKLEILQNDKTEDIYKKFEDIWAKLLINTLEKIVSSKIKSFPQDNEKATKCSKILKEDWKIDFLTEKAEDIYNKYRAYYPWPGIYCYYKQKKFNIEKCSFLNETGFSFKKWSIIKNEKKIAIVCWDKKLLILEQIKLEWKKSMNILSFINWNRDFLDYKF